MSEKHYPTDPRGELDVRVDRDARLRKPCCARIDGGWCWRPDGHDDECDGFRSVPPPSNDFMPRSK